MERTENVAGKTGQSAEVSSQLLGIIRNLLQELHPEQYDSLELSLDSSLDRDLGLESLGRMELLARLEKHFHVVIPEQDLIAAESPRDLLRVILISTVKERKEYVLAEAEAITLAHVESAPVTAPTLVDVLEWHVASHPERPHIRLYSDEGPGEVITYSGLYQGASRIAAGLQQLGLSSGESVVIMLPTGREYFYSFFGVLLAGGIPVPVYPPGRLKQIEEHLRRHVALVSNCLAPVMIIMPEAGSFAKLMLRHVETLHHVVTIEELETAGTAPALRKPHLASENIAFLQYTSGSTGMPKGVVLTHANLLANIRAMASVIKPTADDVFVSWLPLYHDMGLIGAWFGSLHYACQLVIMPPLAFIARPERWLRAIHRFRGTLSAAPNFAYELCLRRLDDKDLEGLDLSSWRCACNGAEAVRPSTVRKFIERFSRYGFSPESMMPVYGLAESSVGLAFPPLGKAPVIDSVQRDALMDHGRAEPAEAEDEAAIRFVSCGRPLPGHQIRVVDENDRELPERHEGRLQFQGPSTTSGYFRNQEKTRELFHGDWLDSGDKAYMADGDVYITGRVKDIIIRAGRNIYPEELETAIGKLEGIREGNVAVFGSTDRETGTERLVVLAETRRRDEKTLGRLREEINDIVGGITGAPPEDVVLAQPNTVLKTSSGKIRRASCRELFERGDIGRPGRSVWLQIARFAASDASSQMSRLFRKTRANIYAAYAWGLFGTTAPLLWGVVVLLPKESWRQVFIRFFLRFLARLACIPIKVFGVANLPPRDAPCIFVSNHASYLDGYVLMAAVPRSLSFIAKAELRRQAVVRILLEKIGAEFVERFEKKKGIDDTQRLIDKAGQGRSFMFFAEGTFMRMSGLLPFRMGAFETASQGGLAIVPIAIRGTRSILRADSWFPRPGRIEVHIGKPITIEEVGGKSGDTWNTALKLRGRSREWILRHCGEPDLGAERPEIFAGNPPQDKV